MAVPIAVIAEHKVVAHFLDAGAISMADAIPFTSAHPARRRAFEGLKGRDILRTDGQGRWWLDEEAWSQHRADRLTRAGLAMPAVGVAAAVAALR